MQIIPAIDIIEGRCVRLAQGSYASKTVYDAKPLDMALRFQDAGCERLHLVDLDGAKAKRVVNYRTLEEIASKTALHIDFGGGVQSDADARVAFECGARQITAGSVAVKNRTLFLSWLERYGAEAVILAADARAERVAVSGWEETTDLSLFDFLAEYEARGVLYAMCTDIGKDGMMQGASFELYDKIRERSSALRLIASGGVSSLSDLERLAEQGLWGAIVGKALYEGAIGLEELKPWLRG